MFEKLKSRSVNKGNGLVPGVRGKGKPSYKEKMLLDDYNVGILMPDVVDLKESPGGVEGANNTGYPAYSTEEGFFDPQRRGTQKDLPSTKVKPGPKNAMSPTYASP